MYGSVGSYLSEKITGIEQAGLFKRERTLESPQESEVKVSGEPVLILCSNNYLGLANHPAIVGAARDALDRWGYGLASVRFICGTQTVHKQLERELSKFLGT